MPDRARDRSMPERVASIETDIRWIKWIVVGTFASSLAGTFLKLGAPPSASAAAGLVAVVVGLVR